MRSTNIKRKKTEKNRKLGAVEDRFSDQCKHLLAF